MVTDPIGDYIIRIKNAQRAKKESVLIPHSKMLEAISEVLVKRGYIKSFTKKGKKVGKFLELELVYQEDGRPKINDTLRISKPGRRMYGKSTELVREKKKRLGLLLVSTPKGVMASEEAVKEKVGGEILFLISQ